MNKHDVKLVGIALTFSKVCRRIRTQNVFRLERNDGTMYTMVENCMDRMATMPFSRIINAFDRLYEQQIAKVWISETEQVRERYFQFDKLTTPNYACLSGHWMLWAEK